MPRFPALLLLSLLAACGRQPKPPEPEPKAKIVSPVAVPAPQHPSADENRTAADAADALRHYYALIGAGDYGAAYKLRSGGHVDEQRFAANFAAYERYSAVVGTPSLPAEASGFVWVQLPVMITGNFKGGKPFGSSGNVMVRRPASGGPWRVVADG